MQIQLSFLMVGHTHEDIDQVFSMVSAYLKKIQYTRLKVTINNMTT